MVTSARRSAASLTVFAAGFAFAAVTSGGIVEERLSSGSLNVALGVNAVVTFAATLVLALIQRRAPLSLSLIVPQVLGAACGIVCVHLALRAGVLAAPSWLSERPAQFVNDAVAVFATLAVVWACAYGLDLRLLVGAMLVVTAYRVTAHCWHLDLPPQGFQFRVQDFVIAQFVGAALALPVYRAMTRHGD
jgi:hypothetical protein